MRKLGIDYGDARVGIAITDALGITAQGLETINRNGSDKVVLRRLDEIIEQYDVDTIVIGKPINMNGTPSERTEKTEQFIHKLKCKYNKLKSSTICCNEFSSIFIIVLFRTILPLLSAPLGKTISVSSIFNHRLFSAK